jgi:hypothetical protein
MVRRWFTDPHSRMNPHLRYAQVRTGHNRNEGPGTGIIEMKDLYYFLDAARLLHPECIPEGDIAVTREDVAEVVVEPPLENWGIRGGIPASEVDLGFNLKV